MSTEQSLSRRGFLRSGLAAGAFLTLPASVYRSSLLADEAPSEVIRIGCIGVGGQGRGNMRPFMKQITALCDVDTSHLAQAAKSMEKANPTAPEMYGDYRKLLESKNVDAVVISTPDHWHALPTIHACQAGKDVYVEKPLSLTIEEGQAMLKAARQHKRIVQTGSQQRSGKQFRQACELVRNGALGKLQTVEVGLPKPNWTSKAKMPVPNSEAPKELDYDFWVGPAPMVPFNKNKVHYLFRFFWNYSGGQQTNFGAHDLDIAQWGLGMDESGPVKISAEAKFHPEGWYETPDWTKITYEYASGVVVMCGQGYKGGVKFIGEKGTIHVNRSRLVADPMDITKFEGGDTKLYVSSGQHSNWLECIKSRELPICDVAIGHRSATVCHLGNIAIRTNSVVNWDPAKEVVVDNAEAAKLVGKEYRKPWKLG